MSLFAPTIKSDQSPPYLDKLQAAAALVAFDRALNSAAWTIGTYALIFFVIGFVVMTAGRSAWLWLGLAIVLLIEAIYLRRVRSGRVILVAGLTLAAFSLWLFTAFVVAWINKDPRLGRGIIAALFLAYGAWNLLTSYRAYKLLLDRSDTAINLRVRAMLDNLRKLKASESQTFIEWRLRGIGEKGFWRMAPEENRMLIAKFADKTFGLGGPVERALWVQPSDVRLEREGEKWIGKKLNAVLMVGAEALKITIEPEMCERLESLLMGSPARKSATETGSIAG